MLPWITFLKDYSECSQSFLILIVRMWSTILRACSHGGGGPQTDGVPYLGGVTRIVIKTLFYSWLLSHEKLGPPPA